MFFGINFFPLEDLKRLSSQEIQEMLKLPIRQRCKTMVIPLHKIPLLFQNIYGC